MVYLILAPGFEEAEALVPADLLRRAGIQVSLVGLTSGPVAGGQGITVLPDRTLTQVDLSDTQMLVLPGGSAGVRNLTACDEAIRLIRDAHNRGIPLAAICAAPTLLGKLGLLEGRRAVCYPGLEDRLLGGEAVDASTVTDGTLITGRAAGSAFDFALALITALCGTDQADRIAHEIHYC